MTSVIVRMVRLELTRANAHYPLKVACLPFHHIRIYYKYAITLNIMYPPEFFLLIILLMKIMYIAGFPVL